MTIVNHILGFPRIGLNRELKKAQEIYWNNKISKEDLFLVGYKLRKHHWNLQKKSGIDLISVGDFAWYDHVLTTSLMLGNIPKRYKNNENIDIDTIFKIGRGFTTKEGQSIPASEMKKWFNTNYHYIVPEFYKNQKFEFIWTQLFDEIDEAKKIGYRVKPVILGPLTYLWLGKMVGEKTKSDRLSLLSELIPVYQKIIYELEKRKIEWIQIDEPILVLELSQDWKKCFKQVYEALYNKNIKILITTYFDSINHNIDIINQLPIQGLHVDLIYGKYDINNLKQSIPENWILSLGIINGRNVWRSDLIKIFKDFFPIINKYKNIWIGPSCSFLHIPIDINAENNFDKKTQQLFSFAIQKCEEIACLSLALKENNIKYLEQWENVSFLQKSLHVKNKKIYDRIANINIYDIKRKNSYNIRSIKQKNKLKLPLLPTTTIGSFPQTTEIRKTRFDFKTNQINSEQYNHMMNNHIKNIIKKQEKIGLDVLVHGEPERNDMVEYFSENLEGFLITNNGWVQSYGSRCVKPPIIISDIYRSKPITIKWTNYAQSLTKKPIKGMLTGPVTILLWSFPREDISYELIAKQIALALRDEVKDLEKSGISIIQIDEPALREGLPLHKSAWKNYLMWAVNSFKLSACVVKDTTQIHTHMCYCEFNDIMESISLLDVDVITIENSRSNENLLNIFKKNKYFKDIGPGIYDVHSMNIPSVIDFEHCISKITKYIPKNQLWINPDCGLKTRNWKETYIALKNMVTATKNFRKKL
ncbi:5-methyltetrahydropteroyltriglutamate--homocysteine S-methyltransferase [Candidatus Tachikawaea gelatinosa]|uniref:5-methyltetrahydropteroyltriglutamate--homocysteine methyltransferase n=1 Tax=Candidatus Tachikawaea gelatinosa TaxID=1410383 RepID=A0A090APQ8_9ENTR|nr:5-methyltetrahydropteroyltriglutamate--homocysteine S-methyltransferase [Candidatus Tachikawaea gelatinosa]BAP58282.1 5-methyltetrahydropteroyltriglutamate--homocysteine methyltransferase [Candidatus Tachikawaea gelatinosa]